MTDAVPAHFFRQSAVLPYRIQEARLEVMIITSRKKTRWVLPKGVCEPELTAAESAAKEALEEAGIEGDVHPEPLGTYQYDKWSGTCSVEVFPMLVRRVHSIWQESDRDRQWVSATEAANRIDEPDLRKIIRAFADQWHSTVEGERM